MPNVIQFPKQKRSPAPERPAGMLDVFTGEQGMVLLDGCVPEAIVPAILALMGTAGVPVTQNA